MLPPHLPQPRGLPARAARVGLHRGPAPTLEYREATDRLAERAAELVRLPVDVLVTWTTPAIEAIQPATTTIPIVMGASATRLDGFVASLARPGGNITGLTICLPSSPRNGWSCSPPRAGLARVAVLWNPANPAMVLEWEETQAAARRLGVELEPGDPESRRIARAFAAATRSCQGADFTARPSLIHLPNPRLAARIRLPTSSRENL